ncbi:MAG: HNH endonuclease [Thermoplasmata archaeon]|nr:HNH endonuclease [Thermoplasmata archaeon]
MAGHAAGSGAVGFGWEGEETSLAEAIATASNDELADAIRQLHGLITTSQATLFEVVNAFSEREAYREDGCRDVASWLVQSLSVSSTTARGYARVAAALVDLPHLAELFRTAQVCLDQLAPITRIADEENDESLAKELPSYSAAQAETLARRARPVPPADEKEAHERRYLSLTRRGQCTRLSGQLAGLDAETVRVALERIAEGYPVNPETGTYDPFSIRLADALAELAGAHIADDGDPDRADVVIHLDPDTLANGEGPVESGSGAELSAQAARRASCDCRYHVWARDNLSGEINLGRTTRSIPAHMSRYLRHRDGCCRFPGCEQRRLLAGHHIWHWAAGGPTDKENIVLSCRFHHRLVHEGGWHIEGNAEGVLAFVSPTGRRVSAGRAPFRQEIRRRFFGDDLESTGAEPAQEVGGAGADEGGPPGRAGP